MTSEPIIDVRLAPVSRLNRRQVTELISYFFDELAKRSLTLTEKREVAFHSRGEVSPRTLEVHRIYWVDNTEFVLSWTLRKRLAFAQIIDNGTGSPQASFVPKNMILQKIYGSSKTEEERNVRYIEHMPNFLHALADYAHETKHLPLTK